MTEKGSERGVRGGGGGGGGGGEGEREESGRLGGPCRSKCKR